MVDEDTLALPVAEEHADDVSGVRRLLVGIAELSRTIARAGSFAVFAVTLAGFVFYPRPWCSHWSVHKTATFLAIYLGGVVAMLCLLMCVIASVLIPWTRSRKGRPLWSAFAANAASLVMALLTPGV
jgi:hypothetical protein